MFALGLVIFLYAVLLCGEDVFYSNKDPKNQKYQVL